MAATVSTPPFAPEATATANHGDQQELTRTANLPSETPLHALELKTLPPAVLPPLPFINSIAELKDLSDAIVAFQKSYEDLRNDLHSVKTSILSLLPQETPAVAPLAAPSSPPKPKVLQKQSDRIVPKSEIEGLCKAMCSRGVREYLATHLSDLPKLREEVPKALKLAPNPPKLVLECLGKFFLTGSKAFTENSSMIPAREASILILVCFLLMMGLDANSGVICIEKSLREEAEMGALAWWKRLIAEGGVANASEIDARGLLLFVSCFGIPASFDRKNMRDLVIAANVQEIASVLKKSHMLMAKIPEIVDGMIKNKMELDAVDIAYAFGLTDKFHPSPILTAFLRKSSKSRKNQKRGSQASAATSNEANKKHLAALISVAKCLERHKLDPAKILPGWQINKQIRNLEKRIAEYDQKSGGRNTANKRKPSEPETSKKFKNQEAKRARHAAYGPQQQKATGRVDNNPNFPANRFPNHANTYSTSPSVVYGGPGAGLPPGFVNGLSANHGIPWGGTHLQFVNNRSHPYLWYGDSATTERYIACQPSSVGPTSLYQASPSMEGFARVPIVSSVQGSAASAGDLYKFVDSVVESGYELSRLPPGGGAAVRAAALPWAPYLYQA